MSEVPLDHELQRLCGTRRVAGDHRVSRHDRADLGNVRIQALRGDLGTSKA